MSEQIKKNDIYTVTIDGYNSEGMGVARIGKMLVFSSWGYSLEEDNQRMKNKNFEIEIILQNKLKEFMKWKKYLKVLAIWGKRCYTKIGK